MMFILSRVFGLLCDDLLFQNREALKTLILKTYNCLRQRKQISASLWSNDWFPIALKVFISISLWSNCPEILLTYLLHFTGHVCETRKNPLVVKQRPTIRLPSHVFVSLWRKLNKQKCFHLSNIQQSIGFRRELKLSILAGGCKHRANTSVVDVVGGGG